MKLENEITIPEPADKVYAILTDIRAVAPCVPGASLESEENGNCTGTLQVKVGPVSAKYQGTLRFVEQDQVARRAVISASASDVHGQGGAEATISFSVDASPTGSLLRIASDVSIQGKIAQVGSRGINKVAQRLLAQFGENLTAMIAESGEDAVTPPGVRSGLAAEGPVSVTPSSGCDAESASIDVLSVLRPEWAPSKETVLGLAVAYLVGFSIGRSGCRNG